MRLKSLHHVRFSVKDLSATEAFALDFGLQSAAREQNRIFMRGAGTDSYHYVASQGDADRLLSIALLVESRDDLEQAVKEHGASPIRTLDGPGGGLAATLVDPEGTHFDLLAEVESRAADPLRPALQLNFGVDKLRKGLPQTLPASGPPQLLRLGHIGLYVKSLRTCASWYQSVLGLLPSDLMHAGPPQNVICGFFRLDRGDEYVDHHTLFLVEYGKSDLHHLSFEVQDFEHQFMAHKWLSSRKREPVWGVGRHPLGCHIFDVWMSPSGYRFETFTDTDLFSRERPTGLHDVAQTSIDTWRSDPPDRYFGPMPAELQEKIRKMREAHGG